MNFSRQQSKIKKINKNFKLLHNYFPAPKVPFVINLASESKEIRELSLTHCLKNIELSAKNKIDFYSAHAGFCIDPEPESLGKFIQIEKKFQRSKHIDIFLESLNKILTFAESLNVNFYIENKFLTIIELLINIVALVLYFFSYKKVK